jgi:ferric-dicitrate binding protein FerR (iron transport regulator)
VNDDNQDNSDEYWDDLFEWFDGRCTPARAAAIERWALSTPEIERRVTVERARWKRVGELAVPAVKAETLGALRSLQRRRDLLERGRAVQASAKGIRDSHPARGVRTWYWIAAILLMSAGLTSWWVVQGSALFGRGSTLTQSYATARGERREILLPDSSYAVMAPGTRLTFRAAAGRGDRAIWLEGEAFLSVRHDAHRPFLVRTRGSITRDIGTTFTVRAYPGEGVSVAVESGSVTLRRADSASADTTTAILSAGDLGQVNVHGVQKVAHADLGAYTSWRSGVLMYDGAPVRDVLADLARAYNLNITCPDSALAERHLVVTISGLSADQALTAVTAPIGARYARHGQDVVVRRR